MVQKTFGTDNVEQHMTQADTTPLFLGFEALRVFRSGPNFFHQLPWPPPVGDEMLPHLIAAGALGWFERSQNF